MTIFGQTINTHNGGEFNLSFYKTYIFLFFSEKTGFDTSCKLSPKTCMKFQTRMTYHANCLLAKRRRQFAWNVKFYFLGKIIPKKKKKKSKCRQLKFILSMLSVTAWIFLFAVFCINPSKTSINTWTASMSNQCRTSYHHFFCRLNIEVM